MQATVASWDPVTRAGSVLLDDGTAMDFAGSALATSGVRLLRTGQRVRLHVDADGPDLQIMQVQIVSLR